MQNTHKKNNQESLELMIKFCEYYNCDSMEWILCVCWHRQILTAVNSYCKCAKIFNKMGIAYADQQEENLSVCSWWTHRTIASRTTKYIVSYFHLVALNSMAWCWFNLSPSFFQQKENFSQLLSFVGIFKHFLPVIYLW